MSKIEKAAEMLLSRGIRTHRYSWQVRANECPKEALFEHLSNGDSGNRMGYQALMGSVFHKCLTLFPMGIEINTKSEAEWRALIDTVWSEDKRTSYWYNGTLWDYGTKIPLALDLTNHELLVVKSFNAIVAQTYALCAMIAGSDFASEKRLSVNIKGVEFHGTMDIYGRGTIADCKTTGMWDELKTDKYTGKRGSPKGSSVAPESIEFMMQLHHYRWLLWKSGFPIADKFGYVAPAAFIPKKSKTDSSLRGSPSTVVNVPNMHPQVYEDNLADIIIGMVSSGFPRMMPNRFGKPACGECRHVKVCMESGEAISPLTDIEMEGLEDK